MKFILYFVFKNIINTEQNNEMSKTYILIVIKWLENLDGSVNWLLNLSSLIPKDLLSTVIYPLKDVQNSLKKLEITVKMFI